MHTFYTIVPKKYLWSFILTTCCFSLWGFANDFTNPLVKVFEQVFIITTQQASWLQFAFYSGYFCMALPAVFFIRRYSYKSAILLGLSLYAIGAMLTIPASLYAKFALFCLASYVITYGLAFLETACNPYILAMGPVETATRRLNLAQAFNPIGSLTGMAVASLILAPNLEVTQLRSDIADKEPAAVKYLITDENALPAGSKLALSDASVQLADSSQVTFYADGIPDFDEALGSLDRAMVDVMKGMRSQDPEDYQVLLKQDLANVRGPYLVIAAIVFCFLLIFAFSKLPAFKAQGEVAPFWTVARSLFVRKHFVEGVIAQLCYVGAQIMCWTFIIHYAMEQVGLSLAQAQNYNIVAMVLFLTSRFICTYLLSYFRAGALLSGFALAAILFLLGAIYLPPQLGLYSLVLVSACMSLMFPTIYGIALNGLSLEQAKLGSAFLIMSIVGGAVLTKLQGGLITDHGIRLSFFLPAVCFVVIAAYGFRNMTKRSV